jgi:hypothetical protein
MIFLNILRKNLLLVLLVVITYILYASIFLKPGELKYFSLVDDGQVVVQSSQYFKNCVYRAECRTFIDQTFEFGTSRFRPSYWVINNINYELFGNRADIHHIYRVYVIGLLCLILLTLILLDLKVSKPAIFLGNVLFYSTISFTENIIRLGTNEPYQVLFLALFSFFYLNLKTGVSQKIQVVFLTVLLIWALFIKENNIAIIPAMIIAKFISARKELDKKYLLWVIVPAFLLVAGMFITKKVPSIISLNIPAYTSNYITSLTLIIKNSFATVSLLLNTLSPFMKITLLLIPLYLIDPKLRSFLKDRKVVYWISFSIFFVVIMFPWKYVLDRYQLVGIFGLVIVMTAILDRLFKRLFHIVADKYIKNPKIYTAIQCVIFILMVNLLSRGLALNLPKTINYRTWFLGFTTFEAEQVAQIAKYSSGGNTIHLNAINNINNWEYLYEIPIHLKHLYRIEPTLRTGDEELTKGDYVIVRSSLDSIRDPQTFSRKNYALVAEKDYNIPQIDVLRFRRDFVMKPIQIFITPPYNDKGYDYFWQIYKVLR